ncbi:unnamed protein product [Symbiodinium sp. CCMP2592]|nr:unnamed protein product [Symbiodinium sp. CCMP2592]
MVLGGLVAICAVISFWQCFKWLIGPKRTPGDSKAIFRKDWVKLASPSPEAIYEVLALVRAAKEQEQAYLHIGDLERSLYLTSGRGLDIRLVRC